MIIIATIHIINIFGQVSMRNVNAKTAKNMQIFLDIFSFYFLCYIFLCGIFGILLGGKNIVASFRSVEKGTEYRLTLVVFRTADCRIFGD